MHLYFGKQSSSNFLHLIGFLVVVFLRGDIYKNEQTHKPYTNMVTNLIRYKLVQKQAKIEENALK